MSWLRKPRSLRFVSYIFYWKFHSFRCSLWSISGKLLYMVRVKYQGSFFAYPIIPAPLVGKTVISPSTGLLQRCWKFSCWSTCRLLSGLLCSMDLLSVLMLKPPWLDYCSIVISLENRLQCYSSFIKSLIFTHLFTYLFHCSSFLNVVSDFHMVPFSFCLK